MLYKITLGDDYLGFLFKMQLIFHVSIYSAPSSVCDLENAGCMHTCTPGSNFTDYTCTCDDGSTLNPDGHSCEG